MNSKEKSKQFEKEKVFRHLQSVQEFEKEIQELRKAVKSWNENGGKLINENTKLKKALKILRNKVVNISQLLKTTFIVYNSLALLLGHDKLTQEEYELLKSVLEEE